MFKQVIATDLLITTGKKRLIKSVETTSLETKNFQ